MDTPPFVEAIVNAIGEISKTEALHAIDREFQVLHCLPEPQMIPRAESKLMELRTLVRELRKALAYYNFTGQFDGWPLEAHHRIYQLSTVIVPLGPEEEPLL